MDRLSVVAPALLCTCCALAAAACDQEPNEPAIPPGGRVNAVLAGKRKTSFADLCDVAPDPAKPFEWPELSDGSPGPASRYRWVNVWATWCKPCVEELPLLTRSFADWKKQGHEVGLTLVSVDADSGAAKTFLASRPGLPPTLQLTEASSAGDWLDKIGLSAGSAIPVHLVLNQHDQLLCARSGGVSQADLERFHRALFP